MTFKSEDLDYLYSALGHETRRSIVSHLGREGVMSFSELMEYLEATMKIRMR